MRGRLLNYNTVSGEGLISGDDGQRYPFAAGNLADGSGYMPVGVVVDFEAFEGRATKIYPLPGGSAGQIGDKNKIAAALLAFFLGPLGIHKFYLGLTTPGIIMLLCGTIGWLLIIPGLAMCIIAFIEFIIYIVKSDQQFYEDYVVRKKGWF